MRTPYLDACNVIYCVEPPHALARSIVAASGRGCEEFQTRDLRLAKAAAGRLRVVAFDHAS